MSKLLTARTARPSERYLQNSGRKNEPKGRAGILLLALMLMTCGPSSKALAQSLSGFARVIDGDTIELAAHIRVRLWGIDAPEGGQVCRRSSGATWDCGLAAKDFLETHIRGRLVSCRQEDVDHYGRVVAECFVNGISLNSALVDAGLALAYRQFADRFVPEENHAQSIDAGMWSGSFTPPWEWRAIGRAAPTTAISRQAGNPTPNPACAIKGNINGRGAHIYHLPGQMDYAVTVVTEEKGERWFCSAEEAEIAGWKPAKR